MPHTSTGLDTGNKVDTVRDCYVIFLHALQNGLLRVKLQGPVNRLLEFKFEQGGKQPLKKVFSALICSVRQPLFIKKWSYNLNQKMIFHDFLGKYCCFFFENSLMKENLAYLLRQKTIN